MSTGMGRAAAKSLKQQPRFSEQADLQAGIHAFG